MPAAEAPSTALGPGTPDWDRGVLKALFEQVFSDPRVEQGGVLVGVDGGSLAASQVTALIPAIRARRQGERATFTHETWARVHEAMGAHYQGMDIVGWYVGRPGYGVFLSDTDVIAHRRFFPRPGQLGLVIDTVGLRGGVFGWDGPTLRLLFEGPISRRHLPVARFPWRAAGLVAVGGAGAGALVRLVTG